MKKFILSIILLLTVVFFSPQKVNAQTDPECYRVYQNEGYKCLQTRTKCTQSCSSLNNLKACHDGCSAQDKICSDQASVDLKACLAAISKEGTKVLTKANAQTKNITCEEWKKIVGTYKCKYTVVTSTVIGDAINPRRDPPNSIWCSDTVDIGDTYINLPVDYKYATSEEQCIYDVNTNLYSGQETNNAESVGSQQSTTTQTKELEEPAGRGIGEFIRKIQSLQLNPFDKPQDQVGSTEQKTPSQTVNDWIMENLGELNLERIEKEERDFKLYGRTLEMTEGIIRKAQEEWKKTTEQVWSEPVVGYVWTDEWPDVKSSSWDSDSGTVIKSDSWKDIDLKEIKEPSASDLTTRTVIFRKGEMEVKVINKNPTENKVNVEVDDFFDIFVIQTHFRVEYDPDKKLGVINVYEGKVDVKTKDGQTIKVKPDGDKPSVVIVSQKLSPIKLAIAGLTLVAVIGGVCLILKRKFSAKGSNKKKK